MDTDKSFDLNLKAAMLYAKTMLESVAARADEFAALGITHELAKPAMPRTCPKCGTLSFCDCVWIIPPEGETDGRVLMRGCPWCGEAHFIGYPDEGTPFLGYEMNVNDMHDDGQI